MLNFLNQIKNSFVLTIRVVFNTDLKPYIKTTWQFVQLILDFFLKTSSSAARILAPATLGRALEMLAKGENTDTKFGMEFSIEELFYLFLFFNIFLQVEKDTRKLLTADVKSAIIREFSQAMVKKIYDIDIETFNSLYADIGNYFYFIQDSCHKFNESDHLIPALIDILLGIITISSIYGTNYASGFLTYALCHTLIYNNLLDYLFSLNNKSSELNHQAAELTGNFYNNIKNMETTKFFGQKNLEIRILSDKIIEFTHSMKIATSADAKYNLLSKIPALIACFIIINAYLNSLKKHDLNEIDNFVFLICYLFTISESINGLNNAFRNSLLAVRQLDEANKLLTQNNEISFSFNPDKLSDNVYAVQFINVSFYFDKKKYILKNINLNLEFGKTYGLIGPSGEGKTVLAKLIAGLLKPTEGTIEIYGCNTKYITSEKLSQTVKFISQKTDFFNASLKYNILYSCKNKEEYLYQLYKLEKNAAKKCDEKESDGTDIKKSKTNILYRFFNKASNRNGCFNGNNLVNYHSINNDVNDGNIIIAMNAENIAENKLNFKIKELIKDLCLEKNSSDNPHIFSGGEQQRVGIARALINKSDITIFDEPTAHLDENTEKKVLTTIKKRVKGTVLFISHKNEPLQGLDGVFKLENGALNRLSS